jgi:hypothetical protein
VTSPNTTSGLVLMLLGVVAAIIGMMVFERRDVVTA